MTQPASQTIGAVERATAVLLLFAQSSARSLGVTEIANSLALSKAVVHRVLASLKAVDLVQVDDVSRRYSLGPAALAVGLAYLEKVDLRNVARPFLERLSREVNETATLSIRHGFQRIYVDQVTPALEVMMTVPLGKPFPLHAGSSSKAFLAFLPQEEQESYLAPGSLPELADGSAVDPVRLRGELSTIRKRGYARSFGERQVDAASVAAPVFNHLGSVVGVISVCGPIERFRSETDQAAKLLLAESREVSRRLGFL